MSGLEMAKKVTLKPMSQIAEKLGLDLEDIEMFGKTKAKSPLNIINKESIAKSKLILV